MNKGKKLLRKEYKEFASKLSMECQQINDAENSPLISEKDLMLMLEPIIAETLICKFYVKDNEILFNFFNGQNFSLTAKELERTPKSDEAV